MCIKSILPRLSYDHTSSVKDYIMLMKPRVMSLVVFTGYCGIHLAPGNIHPIIAFAAIIIIALGSGSAAAINMWYDSDIDCIMQRTQKRPIVAGIISSEQALEFGVITGVVSIVLMIVCVNIISAILLAITILYYIFIYTMWLKRLSVHNVVIGGVAGALPPLIGWSAVTGSISWESLILFSIIFIWTPPHSWALVLFRVQEYKDCSIPMMPVVKGNLYTKKFILFYTICMLVICTMPYYYNMAGSIYLILSVILGLIFLVYVILLFKDDHPSRAKDLFWYSIIYLFGIFFILIIF